MKTGILSSASRWVLVAPLALLVTGTFASAAIIGSDLASDAAYNSGWNNGTDGGTAATFGAWALTATGSGQAGRFIGSSTSLSSPGGDINTAGESFGMFGHSGQTSEAVRNFGGATLSVGQTFSMTLAVNFRNGQKGFDLRNAANAVLFNFNVGNVGAGDAYTVQFATTGSGSIGNTYNANTTFTLSFTQTTAGGGTWNVARGGGITDSDSGTYTGVPENFKLYVNTTTGAGAAEDNLFANSFTVVPEPSSALLFGSAAGLALLRRRRK